MKDGFDLDTVYSSRQALLIKFFFFFSDLERVISHFENRVILGFDDLDEGLR